MTQKIDKSFFFLNSNINDLFRDSGIKKLTSRFMEPKNQQVVLSTRKINESWYGVGKLTSLFMGLKKFKEGWFYLTNDGYEPVSLSGMRISWEPRKTGYA